MEKRVVNQLASAFEQQLLTKGSDVKLVVDVGGEGEGEGGRGGVSIKLVVTEKTLRGGGERVDVGRIGYSLTGLF